ncbi:MAG: hypothetical protein J6T51_03815 [Kiritimatiellae bacterium]|nr:hypothetical protein [Kiritimatiellia bacterium]
MKKLLTMIGAAAVVASVALSSWAATWNGVSSGFTSDGDNWIGGTAPATGNGLSFTNTTERTLYVTNDISSKLGDTTVANGSWEFASTQKLLSGNALLVGKASETVNIVNYADWTCAYYFAIANESNSTVVFTNRAGTIVCNASGSDIMPGMTIGGRYNQETAFTGTSGTFVFEGGTLTCAKAFEVGYGRNCTGVFEQTGGTITAGRLSIANTTQSTATGARGTVLLKGGTFAAQYVAVGSGTGGSLTFDGGTLQLTSSHSAAIQASSKLAVNVGANGGTILLADGISSTIPANISSALSSGTDGGLTIKGTAHLTFSGTLSYSGRTTAEVGTTVIFADPSSIGGGLAITIPETPPDVGVYTVFSTTGSDTLEAAFAAATLPTGDPNAVFRLSADKKSIICLYGDVPQTWIGGATGDLGDGANWSTGLVPVDGNAIITSGSAATLTNSAAFTPDSITFPSDSALVTINGDVGIANLLAITNETSGIHHVFNCPVAFAANADADICASSGSGTYVKYLGGMTMYKPKKAASNVDVYLSGQITLTADIEDWSAYVTIDRLHLVDSGSKLTIPNSVTVKTATPNFTLASGTTLEVQGNMAVTAANGYFSYANAGTMLVSGIASSTATTWTGVDSGSASGVIAARGFSTSAGNGIVFHPKDVSGATLVIGADGLGGTGNYYVQKSLSSTLKPSADYAINAPINSAGSSYSPTLTIGTSDYFDNAVGRKVTVNGVIGTRYRLNVTGIGEVVFNSNSTFTRGTVVSDSATLAVNDGCKPGNGAVTMNGTSTLKVAQSGTVTLGGNLTLTANAALAFNFTDRATAPTLDLKAASTIPATVNVKVSADAGIRPSSSRTHTLTSGYDFTGKTVNLVDPPEWVASVSIDGSGNIVLTAKPNGLIIMFR